MESADLKAQILNIVNESEGVLLQQILDKMKGGDFGIADVCSAVYEMAKDETIVLVVSGGQHWFWPAIINKQYTVWCHNSGPDFGACVAKTDHEETVVSHIRELLKSKPISIEIVTNPNSPKARVAAIDLDSLFAKGNKDCGCPANLSDCKAWKCPRS